MHSIYLFPYESIKKGSKIIIYGAGEVGKSYFSQIQMTGYCNVLYFVDRDYKKQANDLFDVRDVTAISNSTGYDYILISNQTAKVIDEVYGFLVKSGVREESIVKAPERKIIIERKVNRALASYSLKDALSSIETAKKITNEIFPYFFRGDYGYVENIKKEATSLAFKEDSIKVLNGYVLDNQLSDKEKIIFLYFMYEINLFSADSMRLFMQCTNDLQWDIDTKHCLAMSMVWMTFLHPEYLYDTYYTDRRKVLAQITKGYHLAIDAPPKEHRPGGNKRICIIPSHMYDSRSASMEVIANYANAMDEIGHEVAIIPADSRMYPNFSSYIPPVGRVTRSSKDFENARRNMFNENIRVIYAEGSTIREKMQNHINAVLQYDPDIIMDCSDEYVPQMYVLYKTFPTICIPIRGYVTSTFFHVYAARDKSICIEENKKYQSVEADQMISVQIAGKRLQPKGTFERGKYGFDDKDFIIVTVGNRLFAELDPEFIDSVCSLLEKHKDFKWLLVGNASNEHIARKNIFIENKQVILWGYETDLAGLYGMCDIFLNPRRMGGGASIFYAMHEGLPVAMSSAYSDITPTIGIENTIQGDDKALMDYVELLHNDKALYKEKSELMRQKAWEYSDIKACVRKMLSESDSILQNYNREEWEADL